MNIIENSRKGAATDSAYGYKDSVNKTYVAELQNHNKLKLNDTYTVTNGTLSGGDFGDEEITSLPISVSGTVPSSGSLEYQNNVLKEGWLVIGDYRIIFNEDGTVTTVKNNQSGEGQTSVALWDKYYYFDVEKYYQTWTYEESSILDPLWDVWIQEVTSSGEKEICTKFSNGTVCTDAIVTCSNNTCRSKIGDMKTAYESAGAECSFTNGRLFCVESMACSIDEYGVTCYDFSAEPCLYLMSDGSVDAGK